MTDIKKYIKLYKSFGITLKEEKEGCEKILYLTVKLGGNKKIDGYAMFYTKVIFDKDGKFIKQIIAE
jgi:hypothetical protein